MEKTNINLGKFISLMIVSAILSVFIAQTSAFAQEPPSVENLFGDPVEGVDETPPSPQVADVPVNTTTNTNTDYGNPPSPEVYHPAPPTTPKTGPEAMYLLVLIAASLGGGYAYRLKKQDI